MEANPTETTALFGLTSHSDAPEYLDMKQCFPMDRKVVLKWIFKKFSCLRRKPAENNQ